MHQKRIPPFSYTFPETDVKQITENVGELLNSGQHLTMGAHGRALESEFAEYTRRHHAVSVSCGTAALEIILRSLNVAGGEVIVPTNTFGASVVAVLRAGGVPVFADAAEDLAISVPDVARKLSPRVRAVLTVHVGGMISERITELADICAAHSVSLVEDAAHAAGASHRGSQPGSFGVAAAFSLFSTKVMTAGEGGLIATDSNHIRNQALLLRDHAKNPDGSMSTTGYNWRLSEFQAIVARTQLRRLNDMVAARNAVADVYDSRLRGLDGVRLFRPERDRVRNGYKYLVFTERMDPLDVERRLRDEYGITLGGYVYRIPCHRQGAFAEFATGTFPAADRLCATHLCPPIYPGMSPEDAAYVADALHDVLAE